MSETETKNKLYLQLKDIIKIDAPTNDNYHEQTFVITYIDNEKMKLINIENNDEPTLFLNNKTLEDTTIEKIYLISRDDETSYAIQNNLTVDTWINIHFSGNLPVNESGVTGEIINLEEDMIEVKLYPSQEIIYIDFAYKGIPENLNIQKIVITEKPDTLKKSQEKEIKEEKEITSEVTIELADNIAGESLISDQQYPHENIHQQLIDELLNANEIEIGEDLQEIEQIVQKDESQLRYGISIQTGDLLDELLAEIPSQNRTSSVLNKIHRMIERYTQLRNKFSEFDDLGNANMPKIKTAIHKPLIENLKTFNKSMFWIRPVVRNIKNVYDSPNAEYSDDLINNSLYEDLERYEKLKGGSNNVTENELRNKYNDYKYKIYELTKPFNETYEDDDMLLANIQSNSDMDCIVDNLDEFYSSTIQKESIFRKRFLVQKYITDKENSQYSDTLQLKSFLILPIEYYLYSKINLPGTNILSKSSLERKKLFNFDILNNKHKLQSIIVNELNEKTILQNFFNNIIELNYDSSIDDSQKYNNFLQKIIPKTKVVFEKLKAYIHGTLSVTHVLSYLEPFLIYDDELTYMQYKEITSFIKEKNSEFIKLFIHKREQVGKINFDKINYNIEEQKKAIIKQNIFYNLLKDERHPIETEKNLHDMLTEVYKINEDNLNFTSSELLNQFMKYDTMNFHNICATLASVHLLDTVDINKEIEERNKIYLDDINKEKTNNSCGNYFLSKKYIELDELEDDNNKEIFFDKKYDSDERKVEEGNYAVLKEEDKEEVYYKRVNNKWEVDSNVKGLESEQAIFCNIQDKCFQVKKDCNDLSLSESELKQQTIEHILNEFDNRYEISIQELTKFLMTRLNYLFERNSKMMKIKNDKVFKNDREQSNLGLKVTEEELNKPTSPYFSIRDIILGSSDFIKKQYNIIKFVKKYTRDPVSDESPYWLYCRESNLKLLPSFHYSLAKAFIENKDYLFELNKICNERGKLSDDGNAYVDKFSGDHIKNIEFNDDEGYNDKGFKINSREILENNANIASDDNSKLYEDRDSKMIINIVTSMCNFLSIKLNHQYEFIVRNVIVLHEKKMPTKSTYDEQAKKLIAKGKKIQSYTDLYNFSILVNTLALIHVSIQVSIPSIKTKKSFPGKCIKSFDGFPLQLSGTYDGLKYISCVANSIKKKIEPWNTIQKVKEDVLLGKLKTIIEKDIITNPIIKELFNVKNNYLLENGDNDIPNEVDVSIKWNNFLPPLTKVNITHLQPVTTSFIDTLLSNIKKGSTNQHEQLNVLRSKIMYFSHAITSEINKQVDKEIPILTNALKEPYLLNSCCIQKDIDPIINYFIEKNKLIKTYNNYVIDYNNIIIDSIEIPQAPIYLHDNTTKLKYPKITDEYTEETIYKTFIKYCNFNSIFPISKDLQRVCLAKPSSYNINDDLNSNIRELKSEGKIYTVETLYELLKIIGKRNISDRYLENIVSDITKIRSFLNNVNNDPILDESFKDIILSGLDTFEITDSHNNNSSTIKDINDTLYEKNESLKQEINDFIKNHVKQNTKVQTDFIDNLEKWNEISHKNYITNIADDTSYRTIDFIKNITNILVLTLTNMIINKQDLHENVPKHWNLSDNDNSKIRDSISVYFNNYSRFYYGDFVSLLLKIEKKCENTLILQSLIPCFSDIEINESKTIKSVLNCETCKLIHSFLFYSIVKQFILLSDEYYIEKTNENFSDDIIDDNLDTEELLLGNKITYQEEISIFLSTTFEMFSNYKQRLNVTYNDIMNTVNKAKEREKRDFTDIKLKQLSDEARKVNFQKKLLQLDEWNLGNQKGLTTYVKDFKDTGESETFMDMNIYDNSDMYDNQNLETEIYNAENDVDVYQQLEEQETFDISHLAEDDDYGENDGDEGF